MRKTIVAIGVAGLLLSSIGGQALAGKASKARTATIEYANPNAVSTGDFNVSFYSEQTGGFHVFKTKKSENLASFQIEDASGQAVSAALYQNGKLVDRFCGSGDDIKLPGGKHVIIELYAGACEDNTPSVVTQGTITGTFQN
jgi:hypothetical protein